jgi:hypothetical protein
VKGPHENQYLQGTHASYGRTSCSDPLASVALRKLCTMLKMGREAKEARKNTMRNGIIWSDICGGIRMMYPYGGKLLVPCTMCNLV